MSLETLYILHHTHTDIGYTHDQPIVWELHRRFIDRAVELAERDLADDGPHAFRWTCEALGPVLHWFDHATERQRARFLRLVNLGRIEATAMLIHNMPLADTAAQTEMLQAVGDARARGIAVRHALSSDINGYNWPVADLLLDAGIESLTMAINEFNGGAPFTRPNLFRWQSPSGRPLPALNNWIYNTGNFAGLIPPLTQNGRPADPLTVSVGRRVELLEKSIPALRRILARANWPLPFALLPCPHFFGDNAPPDATLPAVVQEWNRRGLSPRLVIATPTMWWDAVTASGKNFPLVPGDWTDYWAFGAGASAREVAVAKDAQTSLQNADALLAALPALGVSVSGASWFTRAPAHRAEAWHALHLWNEHTFESDASLNIADGADSAALWHHKAKQAWTAHSLGKLLLRDAVAELALQVRRADDDTLLVYNPLPWTRTVSGGVPDTIRHPRGEGGDAIASRHYQDHDANVSARLLPVELPAFGYALVKPAQIAPLTVGENSKGTVIANNFHRITFDETRGGIASWQAADGHEWLDQNSPWRAATVIRETPVVPPGTLPRSVFSSNEDVVWTLEGHGRNWHSGWSARRVAAEQITAHTREELPDGQRVTQRLAFADADGQRLPVVTTSVFLPNYAPWVEFEVNFDMGLDTDPEAYYFALPFALRQPAVRLDAGGQAILLNRDQLPNTNRDYFTNHKWCALTDAQRNILVATPVNPLVMFGGFHFGDNRREFVTDSGLFLGWLTNNYWLVNFRARQPGAVRARYRVWPQHGAFAEPAAHRFALDAATPPVLHNLMEPPSPAATLPPVGVLLQLPEPPILTAQITPSWTVSASAPDALHLRLTNASDEPQRAVIASALLTISGARECDFFGNPNKPLPVTNGRVELTIPPRRTAVLQITAKI